jgi:two-component system, cell cycle sensor histidine kinase and response regulator CckA
MIPLSQQTYPRSTGKRSGARNIGLMAGIVAILAVAYWVIEAFLHSRFSGTPFIGHLFTKDRSELAEQLAFLAIMIAFSGVVVAVARREHRGANRIDRENELKRVAIMDNIQEMILLHDVNLNALWANKASGDSLGLRPEEIVGRHCYELWHGRGEPCVVCPVLDAMRTGVQRAIDVYTPDGRAFFIKGYPVRGDDGNIVGAVEVTLDITGRKRAEEELAREKEHLAVTLASIADGVIVTDTSGAVTFINRAAEALSGWAGADALGRRLDEVLTLVDERTRLPRANPTEEVLRTGAPASLPAGTVLLSRDGAERLVADSGAPVRSSDGEIVGAVIVFRDVTEKRRLEEEILKSQKLESLGVLAGGIAHDFNNILTVIIGNASLAQLSLSERDASYAVLGDIEKAAMRARSLTQQLLTFSKGGAPIRKLTPLNDIIRDTVQFALSGSNISSRFEPAAGLWQVDADAAQISHAVNNIVINAREAMPQGGTITIRTENADIPGDTALPLAPGTYVKISIEDQGVGISREDLSKVFDPYFTTKAEQHHGLGLAVAYFVVRKHDGHILVDSEPDVSTVFSIYLPAAAGEEAPVREPAAKAPARAGGGKILVMDDEEIVRDVLGKILARFGYEVTFARHGMEAVEEYRRGIESGNRFDAVIMDLTVIGGLGGKEAIELLRLVDPGATAIVSSGYSDDFVMADYRKYGFDGVIAKPYRAEELSEVLAKVLGRRR